MIEVGKQAPAFTLKNQEGQETQLEKLKGQWIVLYFYPRDDTPGCTVEACDFSEGLQNFAVLDAVILGCSPDSIDSHCKFIEKYNLSITLLSDPDHKVMEEYGAWGEKKMYGRSTVGVKRSTVLIDPSGQVAHQWTNVKTRGHAARVQEKLKTLRSK